MKKFLLSHILLAFLTLSSFHFLEGKSSLTQAKRENGKPKQYPPFGRQMRSEFLMDPNFILLDHGAYGTMPKATRTALHHFQDRAEANPDLWIRREARKEWDKVRSELGAFLNADPADLVLIINTTSGMNAIFRSLIFKARERILHFSTIYGSMGSIVQYLVDTSPANVTSLVFPVTYPISNDKIVEDFEQFLKDNDDPERPIRIALIDHITSVPAAIVPIERIIPILKRYGIEVLIDGAHAAGQIPIDIKALSPDYYITNCHKWLYSFRGSAVMYVDKKHQDKIYPAHINSGYAVPADYVESFFWTGTMDYSPFMTIPAALQFRRDIGGEEAIRNYTHNLALEGGRYLASVYGTSVMQDENQVASMVDVELPFDDHNDSVLNTVWFLDTLLYRFPEVFAAPYKHDGKWYARHSVQIYNDITDFHKCAEVFLQIAEEVNSKNGTFTSISTSTSTIRTTTVESNAARTALHLAAATTVIANFI